MFELFFKYPLAAYERGHLVLLAAWSPWVLALAMVAALGGLAWLLRRHRGRRTAAIWALQSAVIALLLLLLWQPALSLAQLKPQQNIVAVLVDDSRSMALPDAGAGSETRSAAAAASLGSGVLEGLGRRFQVRLYRFDNQVARAAAASDIHPTAAATRLDDSLGQLLDQTADLPIGAIVLLSDGADNSGGLARATLDRLRARHIPVQTVGFGPTTPARDLELEDVQVQPRALEKSRLQATVSLVQHGFAGQTARVTVRQHGQVLTTQTVALGRDGDRQSVDLMFNAGDAGAKTFDFEVTPLPGEASRANNTQSRLVEVASSPHRILYMEGEPRWEYKFIRRAEALDPQVQLVSMLRATENKIYRQGISGPEELADGFPSRPEEMFRYQGLIIGSVAAAYFTPEQQDLIQAFADRRGGGILFMGGASSLADGGWQDSAMAPLLPVMLPGHGGTFVRTNLDPAATFHPQAVLAPAGAQSTITRLLDDPAANARQWQKLPWLMDYQDAGVPKPGATVLAEVTTPGGQRDPLLTIENYGRGRTAVLATSGTWRWQMMLPLGDPSYPRFWQQMLRWLVAGTPGQVAASVASPMLYDHGQIQLDAEVRDAQYNPAAAATVAARILGPNGTATSVPLHAAPDAPGHFSAEFTAAAPGAYLATVTAPGFGEDTVGFERVDGVAENFHTTQNKDLLERLAAETGGQYWQPNRLGGLASEIPYSDAGITLRQNLPLWNVPVVFFLLLALPLLEWMLRRRWGVV